MSNTPVAAPAAAPATTSNTTPEQSADQVMESIDNAAVDDIVEETDTTESAEEIAAQAAKEKQIQALKKKLKLKVNGRELEEEIDFNDDKKLQDMLQKAYSSDEKFQKAAKIEKQMRDFLGLMKQDPIRALKELGHDPDVLAESHLARRIKEMEKSPEQRQLEQLQEEIAKEKSLRERLEQEKFDAEQSRMAEEYSRSLNEEITSALQASDLPKSPYVVKRVGELLMIGLSKNKELSVKDVLPIAEKQIKAEIRQMFEAMPEDIIEAVLGDSVSQKLRKRRLAKMKPTIDTASQVKPTGKSEIAKTQAQVEEAPIVVKDFFKKMGSN